MKVNVILFVVFCSFFLGACASIPTGVSESPQQNPVLTDVQADLSAYQGKLARWAGDIVAVENSDSGSLLFVIARDVTSKGEPIVNDLSLGRFAVRLPAFAEPEIYKEGRKITVKGVLGHSIQRKIGDFGYTYPVINADAHYLWPKRSAYKPVRPYRHHWSYDDYYPWYWYPYYDY